MNKNNDKKTYAGVVRYFDGETLVEEQIEAAGLLRFLYCKPLGRLVRLLFTRISFLSHLNAWYQCSSLSKSKIKPFIQKHAITMHDFVRSADEYASFNDFFCRQLKPGARSIDRAPDSVISPADGKLLVVEDIAERVSFFVKNEHFNLSSFLHDSSIVQEFEHATMLLFRLAPYDYHRFHFPIDARVLKARYISGFYESVNPLAYAAGVQPLTENLRYVISLFSDYFGHVLMIPVGAAMVGSVVFTYESDTYQKKGSEAGYFQFGGSSVVLLFKSQTIKTQEQFLKHSLQGFETAVKMGQTITE